MVQSIPYETLCLWEIDARSHYKSNDVIKVDFRSKTVIFIKSSEMILILSYTIQNLPFIQSLDHSAGVLFNVTEDSIALKGNYLLISYWQNMNSSRNVEVSWNLLSPDSNTVNISLVLGILIPCIFICLCILCADGYYRKKNRDRARVHVAYQIMDREEQINYSYIQSNFPMRYYLSNIQETCPICFDK